MSDEKTNNDEQKEIVMSGKVPYLAIMGTILRESKDAKAYFDTIDKMMQKDENWDEVYSRIESDPSHKNNSYFAFQKTTDTLDLAVSCMVVAASNTFSNTKKDVLITPDTVYVTQLVMEQVWRGKDKKFEPSRALTREGFKDNVLTLSKSGTAVVPVDEEIALLHGPFYRDTWKLLNAIISPVDLPKSAYRTGDGKEKIYGLMFMVGESYEALAMLCDAKDNSMDKHVTEDLADIMLSFTKEKKDEEDNNVPSDENK